MSISFRIALRYLFAPKSHSAVNVISLVAIGGIALATAALVVVMSVFNGFHHLISTRLSELDPPLSAVAIEGKTIEAADSLCALLEADSSIAMASPIIHERALASFGERQMTIRIRGIRPELYRLFGSICPAGEPWADYHPDAAAGVLSVGVANRLEVPVGSESLVGLYVPRRQGRINPANPMSAFRSDSIAPSAVYLLNQPELDTDIIYAPFDVISNLLQFTDGQASELYIYPTTTSSAAKNAAERILGSEVKVMTLLERQSGSFQIVNMEKWMTFMLLGFIMLIASFNIVSSLSLLIIEKRDNAVILRSLGATESAVCSIYRTLGMLITCAGTAIGLLLGTLLSLGQEYFGWVKLSGDAESLTLTAYPVQFQIADLLPVTALALAIGLAASLLTTRRF